MQLPFFVKFFRYLSFLLTIVWINFVVEIELKLKFKLNKTQNKNKSTKNLV